VPSRFRGLVPRSRLFVPIVILAAAVLFACAKKEPTGVHLCIEPPQAAFFPDKKSVYVGDTTFQVGLTVVDCRHMAIEDEYTWGTTDSTVIEVSPDGFISPVGVGTAYATVTGRDNGFVGQIEVQVKPG
jgi:hypothetical protein